MKYFLMIWLFAVVTVLAIMGSRGSMSRKPPLYLFPDMDIQARGNPQGESGFFDDRRVDRQPVPGTILRGYSWEKKEVFEDGFSHEAADNPPLYTGKTTDGEWFSGFPISVDESFVQLGKEKYEIFCTACHGQLGNGKGIVASDGSDFTANRGYFGYVANLTTQTYIDYSEGQLYDRITNGWNTMYPYKDKLTPRERWAVVAYMRALQLAANATVEDVPEANRKELGL